MPEVVSVDREMPSRRSRVVLATLLLAVLALDLTGLRWGLPHTLAPHPDDVAKPSLEALQERFLAPTKYGKVHILCVAAAYTPYLGLLWARGELDLSGGASAEATSGDLLADPVGTLSELLYIARLTEVLAHLLAVALVFALTCRVARSWRAASWLAASFGLSPWVVFFTKTSTVDVPMLMWATVALWFGARAMTTPSARALALFLVSCVLAVGTKEQAAFYLAPGVVAVLVGAARTQGVGVAARRAVPGVLAGLALYALLNDLFWASTVFLERWGAWGGALSRWRDEVMPPTTPLALARQVSVYTCAVLGAPLVIAGAWASLRCLRARDTLGLLLLGQLVLYPTLLVAWLGFVQPRYMMPQLLTVALLVARACRLGALRPSLVGLAATLLAFGVVRAVLMDVEFLREPRAEATAWLVAHAAPGASIEYFQKPNSLPGVHAAGLTPLKVDDMSWEGLRARRPTWVIVVDNERWRWSDAQIAFVDLIRLGDVASLGYERARFGRVAPTDERWFLPHGLDLRLRPEIVILRRVERG